MDDEFMSSDAAILDLLRKHECVTVLELARGMQVTATAVRQRLVRLMSQGYVERRASRGARGRHSHRYVLSAKGRRRVGVNFSDLAIALWSEIQGLGDREIQGRLMAGISRRLAGMYAAAVHGASLEEKMQSLAGLFGERRIPLSVGSAESGPTLTVLACPYPDLAEQDRSVCSMERQLFATVLGENMRLDRCRLDGGKSCQFAPVGAVGN